MCKDVMLASLAMWGMWLASLAAVIPSEVDSVRRSFSEGAESPTGTLSLSNSREFLRPNPFAMDSK